MNPTGKLSAIAKIDLSQMNLQARIHSAIIALDIDVS